MMEVYDFGLDFGLFFQILTAALVGPIAIAVGFEMGLFVVYAGMRWIRRLL